MKKPGNKFSLLIVVKNICLQLFSASIIHETVYSENYAESSAFSL